MLGDKLREVGHDAEAEHAPAEREQHVCSRLRAGRGAPLRGGERLGPDTVGRVQGQGAVRPDPFGRDRRPAEGRALGELRRDDVPREPRRAHEPLSHRPRAPRDGGQRELLHDEHPLPARRARDVSAPQLLGLSGRGLDVGRHRRGKGDGAEGRGGRHPGDPRGLQHVLPRGQPVHRRRRAVDRRYPARVHPRVPRSQRRGAPRLDEGLHGAGRVHARRRLQRAGRRRPRLHRAGHRRGRRELHQGRRPQTACSSRFRAIANTWIGSTVRSW